MKDVRDGIATAEHARKSMTVCNALESLTNELDPKVIHTYISFGSEVDLWPMIHKWLEEERKVVCPRTLKDRKLQHLVLTDINALETGRFGTQHPSGDNEFSGEMDLIIIPGLAFDREGGRLGYGAGYYDTFLEECPDAMKVGVCFEEQLCETVPMEPHDVRLDRIISG